MEKKIRDCNFRSMGSESVRGIGLYRKPAK
jgi:hypothetical protein